MRKAPQLGRGIYMYENKWELWHTIPDNGTFQLTYWDAPIPTIRKILKRIRNDYPIYEFRSKISRSPYSAGVKYIEVRRKIPWDLKYLDNYYDVDYLGLDSIDPSPY